MAEKIWPKKNWRKKIIHRQNLAKKSLDEKIWPKKLAVKIIGGTKLAEKIWPKTDQIFIYIPIFIISPKQINIKFKLKTIRRLIFCNFCFKYLASEAWKPISRIRLQIQWNFQDYEIWVTWPISKFEKIISLNILEMGDWTKKIR